MRSARSASKFGREVAQIVDGVSKLSTMFRSRAEAQAENFQKMAIAMAKDLRVILVKLADRLHNMRTVGVLGPDKRRRIARETLDFYAPIANRLGIHTLKIEIEDLAFNALYPLRADRIRRAVAASRGNRKALMEQIDRSLATALRREGIDAIGHGAREAHLFHLPEDEDASTNRSTRSWMCSASASSSIASMPAIACSASCTTCTNR